MTEIQKEVLASLDEILIVSKKKKRRKFDLRNKFSFKLGMCIQFF